MKWRGAFALVLLAAVGATALHRAQTEQRTASLHVLNVGQGDAILVRSGSTDVLVDGGPDETLLRELSKVRPAWDRRIEVLVLTHPQQDHFAGFLPLLERERVGLVLLPQLPARSALFQSLVDRIVSSGVPVRFARAGQRLSVGAVTLTVLAPDDQALSLGRVNANNGAIVLRADVGERFSALLTGDIERAAEHLVVRGGGQLLDVDVLKVAHHGSKTSTTARLLQATTPAVALVSVGAGNRFGHPHASVIQRLQDIRTLRTDEHGTLSLIVRDGRVLLACAKGACGNSP